MSDSRRAILVVLKQRGTATISEVAEILNLTGEAVRQQLLLLQQEGWVEAKTTPREKPLRTGRPAASYRLTQAGDHLFPKRYDELTVGVLDAVEKEVGPEAVRKVLARLADDRFAAVAPSLRGLPLADRVTALKSWYLEDDPFMQVDASEDSYRLVERNCPFLNTALRRPALCSVSVNALTKALGYRVIREEKFQHGDGRCVFRVLTDEPIDPATWEFRLEPEFTR